ncbi:MAG: hypothetical protein PVH88_26575 [Ignavibacteria bacterium]|jgi:hypothetical protein
MKDITIPGQLIKKEIRIWVSCLVIAVLVNIYAIVEYNASWVEVISQLHTELLLAFLFYLVATSVRIILAGIKGFISYLKVNK